MSSMGTSRFPKEKYLALRIIGVRLQEPANIPGLRPWAEAHLPGIHDPRPCNPDHGRPPGAEITTRTLAAREGIFAGVSWGGAMAAAHRSSNELSDGVIAVILCDRHLSAGVFASR
jgi:cysteine synthase B